ncbi:MAG TPA: prolyl aminopeptidase [Candidatus Binatia bacterium]|nr:prolyl aminopeptidase [Candidatus Binatia bacterium]
MAANTEPARRKGRDLYPEIAPYQSGMLPLDDIHTMYFEQSGNPDGVPVVFLHGGPGGGAGPMHRRMFDPAHYRIVIFDQRGAGRSKPLGEIRNNTTPLLIEDIETLRRHLGIERWFVWGGSWGSTLAIAYAEHHPDRVRGMALRGIFLCRKSEIDWFLHGLRWIQPEAWRRFAEFLPGDERGDLLESYHRRLMDPDPAIHMPAAKSWSLYEGACSTLLPSPGTLDNFADPVLALGLARMEAHYFRNNIFLPENFLLEHVDRIRHIPAFIVQGRYDLVCPIRSADDLARAWPEARYQIIPDAGHAKSEPGIQAALIDGMDRFRALG